MPACWARLACWERKVEVPDEELLALRLREQESAVAVPQVRLRQAEPVGAVPAERTGLKRVAPAAAALDRK